MIMDQTNVVDSSGASVSDGSSNISSSSPTLKGSAATMSPPSLGGSSHSPVKMSQSPNVRHQSPPQVSTPTTYPRLSMHHLPHNLGLLNSLSNMVHHSPLDLISMHHHAVMPPRSYNSPPPISSSDVNNECKMVNYRGQQVAAFMINGETMLCLPQAFELFLKHFVGGLHTVYTKLKRLDIVPLVCNVEQVRVLRSHGAIQPGVNRCKLLSCKDFDTLYRDCTTARCMISHKGTDGCRPGRPPKRASSVGLSIAATHLSQMKRHARENGEFISASGGYENGHLLNDASRLEKSPLLANGYNHPPLNHMHQFMQFNHHHQAAAAAAAALSAQHLPPPNHRDAAIAFMKGQSIPPATMEALARSGGNWENWRTVYEDFFKHVNERLRDDRGDGERNLPINNKPNNSQNGSINGHSPVLNLSKGGDRDVHSGSETGRCTPLHEDREDDVDTGSDSEDDDDKDHEMSDCGSVISHGSSAQIGALNFSGTQDSGNISTQISAPGQENIVSSTESILRNIHGLLKVAIESARQQERQTSFDKAELKMDILREREIKESLERRLADEQKIRLVYQKRLRKERRSRKRFQEQLESELKRRQVDAIPKGQNQTNNSTLSPSDNTSRSSSVTVKKESNAGEREKENKECATRPSVEAGAVAPVPVSKSDIASFAGAVQQAQEAPNEQPWNYSSLDLLNSGAAFWQNYSEMAQEFEMKSRQQQVAQHVERGDSKSPLQDARAVAYYKNSVLFSTAT